MPRELPDICQTRPETTVPLYVYTTISMWNTLYKMVQPQNASITKYDIMDQFSTYGQSLRIKVVIEDVTGKTLSNIYPDLNVVNVGKSI